MAQLVEHILGKDEVPGPNPGSSSKRKGHPIGCPFLVAFGAATIGLGPALPRTPRKNSTRHDTDKYKKCRSARRLGRIRFAYPATERVELARKRQGVGIFTEMPSDTVAHLCEYPGSADRRRLYL